MEVFRETVQLFMALSPLHEAVIRATSCREEAVKLKHRIMVVDATFRGATMEVLCYLKPRLASNNWISTWKGLWLMHIMLNEGDNSLTVEAIHSDRAILQALATKPPVQSNDENDPGHVRENIFTYAEYVEVRASKAHARGIDLGIPSPNTPDYRHGDVLKLLKDGIFDNLLALVSPLTDLRFYVDDFNHPAVLQGAQALFDDFIYLYGQITALVLNILENCHPIDSEVNSDLKLVLQRYSKVHLRLQRFLTIMRKIEVVLGRRVPTLLSLPDTLIFQA